MDLEWGVEGGRVRDRMKHTETEMKAARDTKHCTARVMIIIKPIV